MNRLFTILIISATLTLLLITCKKTPEIPSGNKIKIGETITNSLSYFTAKISTIILTLGTNEITQYGHCWSTEKEPTIENHITTLGELSQPKEYTSELTNLTSNTKYYIRSYVTYKGGILYGDEINLQTLETGKPIVTTNEVTNITISTATCGGTNDDGGLTISQRGLCWNTTGNPTLENSIGQTTDGTGTGSFTSEITDLNEGTAYYVTAYATNEKGSSYGNVVSFTSLILSVPNVSTTAPTNITNNTVTSGGNVTSDGNGTMIARGVCWNTVSNPTIMNSHTTDGLTTGTFTSNITGLLANTKYYIRAYATNNMGTSYGNEFIVTTLETPWLCGTQVIYSGQGYNTVLIGTQCWFKDNLNYQTGNSWCYSNEQSNCDTFGRLYDWETIMNGEASSNNVPSGVQGICPLGWHIPSDEEWKILEGNTDTQYPVGDPVWDETSWRGYDLGENLKSTSGWNSNGNGNDNYGFSAKPGGYRGSDTYFRLMGSQATWWSSSDYSSNAAWSRGVNFGADNMLRSDIFSSKDMGYSIRCLKD